MDLPIFIETGLENVGMCDGNGNKRKSKQITKTNSN